MTTVGLRYVWKLRYYLLLTIKFEFHRIYFCFSDQVFVLQNQVLSCVFFMILFHSSHSIDQMHKNIGLSTS